MPINHRHYHPDWKDKIRPAILKRDNYRCRECGVPNKIYVVRMENGDWVEADDLVKTEAKRVGQKITRIILTVAHLNHIVFDNREENLKSLCQLHHLRHDAPHKAAMQKVARLWSPEEAIKLTQQDGGEIYLNHLFVLARARRNNIAQLLKIKKSRRKFGEYSQYDKDLTDLIARTKWEYVILVKQICKILSSAYGMKNCTEFLNDYWASDLKMIGLKPSEFDGIDDDLVNLN